MMNIQSNHPAYQNYPPVFSGNRSSDYLRIGREELFLRHETSFFRECKTLKRLVNYLQEHFPNEMSPKIIVGACSSGEEALSIKMLSKNKTPQILGFDIGPNIVKQANSLTFRISKPSNKETEQAVKGLTTAYDDAYLAFKIKNSLTPEQTKQKQLFGDTFEEIKPKFDFFQVEKFMQRTRQRINGETVQRFDTKTFRVKNSKDININFVEGDIEHLDNIVPKNEAHAITFRNALYHLLTRDIPPDDFKFWFSREPKTVKESIPIMKRIALQVNKALKKDGIFVLGEREENQLTDVKLVCEVLEQNGFKKAINTPKDKYCNIWAKYKDVE